MVFKKLIVSLIIVLAVCCAAGMPFLFLLAHYTSWRVAGLQIVASAMLGLLVLAYGAFRVTPMIEAKMNDREPPEDALLDGVLIFLAGIMLILPGILTDVVGLLLLIPPVRRRIVRALSRWPSSAK